MTSILQTAATRLAYLGDVQNILASNLANVDTPDYRPVSAGSFDAYLNGTNDGLAMLQNDAADLQGEPPSPAAADSGTGEYSPDGNAVSLDKQLVQIAKNETDQQFTGNIYQVYMGMFKTALGTSV